jgi:hypothetical protein
MESGILRDVVFALLRAGNRKLRQGDPFGMQTATKRPLTGMAALVAALIVVSTFFNNMATPKSYASSHREAPIISQDPTADNTDLYAFVSPDKPDTVTIISDYYPGEDPAGGPNFYAFGDDVLYDIDIDNNGDALPDITYRFDFYTTVANPEVPLYNTGPITSLDDADWNVKQGYTVTKITADGSEQLSFEGIVPPVNIGPTSTPNSKDLASAAVIDYQDGQYFAGQRDDPFWVDLGGVFDLLTIRKLPGNAGGGIDDLQGLNVQSIAIQVPISDLTSTGKAPTGADDPTGIIGVWSTANRFSTTVIASDGSRTATGDLVQVSRLGMPLVNEVVIPIGEKDKFNASEPKDDAQFLDAVIHPVLPSVLNALYGITVPDGDRNDLVAVFLTGVPGLNQPDNVKPSEELRLNTGIPPAKAGTESPLGVLGGDLAGFPNGRRLGDDVVDIALRVVAGVLVSDEFNVAPNNQLGDGSDKNDHAFLGAFPYVATSNQGFEHKHHRSVPRDTSSSTNATPEASGADVADAAGVTVALKELNDSGVSGTATLTADGDKTNVVIQVDGATGDHPVHIHTGSCDSLGEVAYPLTNIDANGHSETTVDISLDDLTAGDFAINAHKSADEIAVYVACGEIPG